MRFYLKFEKNFDLKTQLHNKNEKQIKLFFDFILKILRDKIFMKINDITNHNYKNFFNNYNDLLLDHTPLSIGVSCFYFILEN